MQNIEIRLSNGEVITAQVTPDVLYDLREGLGQGFGQVALVEGGREVLVNVQHIVRTAVWP